MRNESRNYWNFGEVTKVTEVLIKRQIYHFISKIINYLGVEYLAFYKIIESAKFGQITEFPKLPKMFKNLRDASYFFASVLFIWALLYMTKNVQTIDRYSIIILRIWPIV